MHGPLSLLSQTVREPTAVTRKRTILKHDSTERIMEIAQVWAP